MHGLYQILFYQFETGDLAPLVALLKAISNSKVVQKLYITGGGAFKFHDLLTSQLEMEVVKVDEFQSLSLGLEFLKRSSSDFSFGWQDDQRVTTDQELKYPFLLANIGSGVSLLKFNGPDDFKRVGGTPLGGGTFLGLSGIMTGQTDFDTLLDMSQRGDSNKVDLQVRDVTKSALAGLSENSLAISLSKPDPARQKEDVVKSLL